MHNTNLITPSDSLEIYESTMFTVQYRFPRSKKKRIRKKWSKRPENFRPDPKIYQIGNKFYAHPQTAQQIKNKLSPLASQT